MSPLWGIPALFGWRYTDLQTEAADISRTAGGSTAISAAMASSLISDMEDAWLYGPALRGWAQAQSQQQQAPSPRLPASPDKACCSTSRHGSAWQPSTGHTPNQTGGCTCDGAAGAGGSPRRAAAASLPPPAFRLSPDGSLPLQALVAGLSGRPCRLALDSGMPPAAALQWRAAAERSGGLLSFSEEDGCVTIMGDQKLPRVVYYGCAVSDRDGGAVVDISLGGRMSRTRITLTEGACCCGFGSSFGGDRSPTAAAARRSAASAGTSGGGGAMGSASSSWAGSAYGSARSSDDCSSGRSSAAGDGARPGERPSPTAAATTAAHGAGGAGEKTNGAGAGSSPRRAAAASLPPPAFRLAPDGSLPLQALIAGLAGRPCRLALSGAATRPAAAALWRAAARLSGGRVRVEEGGGAVVISGMEDLPGAVYYGSLEEDGAAAINMVANCVRARVRVVPDDAARAAAAAAAAPRAGSLDGPAPAAGPATSAAGLVPVPAWGQGGAAGPLKAAAAAAVAGGRGAVAAVGSLAAVRAGGGWGLKGLLAQAAVRQEPEVIVAWRPSEQPPAAPPAGVPVELPSSCQAPAAGRFEA